MFCLMTAFPGGVNLHITQYNICVYTCEREKTERRKQKNGMEENTCDDVLIITAEGHVYTNAPGADGLMLLLFNHNHVQEEKPLNTKP